MKSFLIAGALAGTAAVAAVAAPSYFDQTDANGNRVVIMDHGPGFSSNSVTINGVDVSAYAGKPGVEFRSLETVEIPQRTVEVRESVFSRLFRNLFGW